MTMQSDINVLIAGLGKLPLKVAADIWMRVKAQSEAQMAKPKQSPEET